MSVKIYTGFVFNTNDIRKALSHVHDFSKMIKPLVHKKVTNYFATECANALDERTLGLKEDDGKDILYIAWEKFRNEIGEVKTKGIRNSFVDYEFNLTLFPLQDKILGMVFTEQAEFQELWMHKNFLSEYGYWDNTDEPEEMDAIAWARRKRDWMKEAFAFSDVPSMAGLSVNCVSDNILAPTVEEILAKFPSFETRLNSVTNDQLFREYTIEHKVSDDNVMKVFREFNEWRKTDEGKVRYEEVSDELRPKLIMLVSKEHLINE